jgi:MFS family permease
MFAKIRTTYNEFPTKYWVLVSATFIDRIGGTLIFPFFALYVTEKFNVGMTEAGVLLGIFSISGLVGSMLGGALTDKFGRKIMVLFGLVFSAMSSLAMGFVSELSIFYGLAIFVGIFSDVAGPARQAMVADLLPEKQRAEGYGILRVVGNFAWIIGPTIGGFLAARSYLTLFILDAVASLITAVIVFRLIPETKPEASEDADQQSILQTFIGYRVVLKDKIYILFLLTGMLMLLVYQQMYSTLSVYLRDVHSIPTQQYGMLMSSGATTVVIFQFWVMRKIKAFPPMLMMMVGTLFYLVGFSMYGFVKTYPLFIVAMLVITVGEMIVIPVSQALVARFAPEDMRGRYMAFFTLTWAIPSTVGTLLAGLIMDNFNPNWVWYLSGIISAVAAVGFYILFVRTRSRFVSLESEEEAGLPAAS